MNTPIWFNIRDLSFGKRPGSLRVKKLFIGNMVSISKYPLIVPKIMIVHTWEHVQYDCEDPSHFLVRLCVVQPTTNKTILKKKIIWLFPPPPPKFFPKFNYLDDKNIDNEKKRFESNSFTKCIFLVFLLWLH